MPRPARSALLRLQSDERLVELAQAGHEPAFEAIVARYRQPLLRYVRRIVSEARAEDVVQQALLNAHVALPALEGRLDLRPWLYRIAHNAALNALRERGWNHDPIDDRLDGVERPEQVVERRERLREVVRAVQALPEGQRNAIVLRELHGLSHQEIAVALGVGDGAARQLIHRARTALRSSVAAITPPGLLLRFARDAKAQATLQAAGKAGLASGAAKTCAAVAIAGVLSTGAVYATGAERAAADRTPAAAAGQHRQRPAAAAAAPAGTGAQAGPAPAARPAGSARSRAAERRAKARRSGDRAAGGRDRGGSATPAASEGKPSSQAGVDAAPPDADPQRDRAREDDGGGHAGDQADDAAAADDEAPESGHDGAADGGAESPGDGGSAPAEGGDAAPSTDVGGDGVPSSGDGPPAADPEPLDIEP